MTDPVFVSFATAGSGYVLEIERLRRSLDEVGLEHRLETVPDRGSWQANCAWRPTWLRRRLDELARPVVWVDADAVVRHHPEELFRSGYDLMAWFHAAGRLAGGTTYWAPTRPARALLAEWERRASQPVEAWPDSHLKLTELHLLDAYRVLRRRLKVNRLAESYCRIFDWGQGPAIIEHFQASRRYKSRVGDARRRRSISVK
ncbi:MAG: hypothetical protein R3325_01865 [Thermoanaerobaculia bacterium]|nr:hypothetical protein [Thermoanaerobaculia bacterium]